MDCYITAFMKHLYLVFILSAGILCAQDPFRFAGEVGAIKQKYDTLWDPTKESVVFTGSSTIRLWKDLPELFPGHQIINTGFGGSHTSDLLAHSDDLIIRYRPRQVFIYEGDNDLSQDKKPRLILEEIKILVNKIREGSPAARIVLFAAKPSLARWYLKPRYKRYNRKLKRLCRKDAALDYANTWTIMLDGNKPREDLFIADGLHMNKEGYKLWYDLIKTYLN